MEQKSIKQTLEQLNSCRENGLTTEEALKRQEVHGKNELPKAKKKTIVGVFFSQMNNAMIYILLVAAVISFVMALIEGDGSFFEPILILAIVLLNAVIGAIQELKADKALEALEKLSAPTTVVRRDGELKEIKASELVPGDIVIIEDGRTIPADLRLISSANLKVSEASLTGESVPVEKDANIVYDRSMPIGDRKNVVYMSTPVVYGRGEGVVIGTGLQTEIGQIAKMLQTTKQEETPLQKRLADLSKLLGIITFVLVALLFIIALIKDPTWDNIKNMFLLSISLAVAAVPEGLPAVVTITLALGVQRMVKVHTITRRLPSVETLGAVSVICSDKTGTLTQNVMTVVSAYTNEKQYEVEDFSADTVGELADGLSLCSDASVDHGVYGDPTEIALVNFANLIDHHKDDLEAATP
ncbi:MAG TPA: HAD-IC family P-type ATPase, partial [Bacilli bacterium]|nr:HAD-IC family P-type ATPase [Bacilli bacterium]